MLIEIRDQSDPNSIVDAGSGSYVEPYVEPCPVDSLAGGAKDHLELGTNNSYTPTANDILVLFDLTKGAIEVNQPAFLKDPLSRHLGLLVLRCVAGLSFALHGYGKIFGDDGVVGFSGFIEQLGIPFPLFAAWLAALAEFVGGLALISGLGARLMSVPLMFTMLTAAFMVHPGEFPGKMEFPLLLATAALVIGLMGPGKYAIRFGESKS